MPIPPGPRRQRQRVWRHNSGSAEPKEGMMTNRPSMTAAADAHKTASRQGVKMAPPKITIPDLNMTLEKAREEVEDAYTQMKDFYAQEPDQVMRFCAGHCARLGEIRMYVQRHEDTIRPLKQFRINELEPAVKDLQFQYQAASRLLEQRKLDWEMAKVGM